MRLLSRMSMPFVLLAGVLAVPAVATAQVGPTAAGIGIPVAISWLAIFPSA